MVALKITKFVGTAPRNSPELLGESSAQVARNSKLYSGDLLPYPQPLAVANSNRTGTVRTLYGLRTGADTSLKWLTFANKVDIATPATEELDERRFYYTGDGAPKVSTYALAVGSSVNGPYPVDYYDLGLPLPSTKPTITVQPFTKSTVISYERDSANLVTLKTVAPHGLKTGAVVSISGFSYRTGSYSRSGTTITVTITGHGLATGASIFLEFASGGATTNTYIVTVTGVNTFTCTDTVSGTVSGTVKWDIRDLNTIASASVIDATTISYFAYGPAVTTTTVMRSGTYTQTASATATITLTGHGLTTGDVVYLTFTSGTATSGTYSVTVTSTSAFTVILPASATTSGNVNVYLVVGTVDLGDQVQGRSYLYTWYTPWREESIGSDPTDPVFMREGQTATVTGLPTAPPTGKNNIKGVRLYRTLATTSGSAFFLLKTLWFPTAIASVSRTAAGVARITMPDYHNLIVGDRIKLVCTSDPSFNATGALITRVVDSKTFEFAQAGATLDTTAAVGTLYYDVAEKKTDAARYWGDASLYTFTDDFSYLSLLTVLRSTEYEAPPAAMQGLTALHNQMMAGFVGNDLYFCEPGQYHAWPSQYRISFEYDIVALASIGGVLLVLTKGYPYVVEGSSPAIMVPQKLAVLYPCVSAASVVSTSFGIVWATHDGLAVYGNGAQLLTKAVHASDTWNADVNPEEIVGAVFKENYIGSTATAALTLEALEGESGTALSFVDLDFQYTASWYDNETNALYTAAGTNGDVYRWDSPSTQNMTMRWKSKVFITDAPMNLGAARVVADYSPIGESPLWDAADYDWDAADFRWEEGSAVVFNLYINKQLLFTVNRFNGGIFRLPAGYKSDTFEVEVYSDMRVRAIHIGETPTGLAEV